MSDAAPNARSGADLARAGRIRAALFLPQFDNDPASGALRGRGTGAVAVEITRILAARLGIEAQVVGYSTPSSVAAALKAGDCDLAFMGIEPSRAADLDFSPAIFHFDYTFLVPAGSGIGRVADADRPGLRVAIVRDHASSLTLSRIVKHAELVGAALPDAAFDMLRAGTADALALPRDVLLDLAAQLPGARVLDDAYGFNRVGIAIRAQQPERLAYLSEFVEAAKASGLIARAIDSAGVRGFRVAPPSSAG